VTQPVYSEVINWRACFAFSNTSLYRKPDWSVAVINQNWLTSEPHLLRYYFGSQGIMIWGRVLIQTSWKIVFGSTRMQVIPALFFKWAPSHEGVLEEWSYSSTHSWPFALEGVEWSASHPGRFTSRERARSTHWIGGWVGSRDGLDAGLEPPDYPARSPALYHWAIFKNIIYEDEGWIRWRVYMAEVMKLSVPSINSFNECMWEFYFYGQ
jgi:hypothetical protein